MWERSGLQQTLEQATRLRLGFPKSLNKNEALRVDQGDRGRTFPQVLRLQFRSNMLAVGRFVWWCSERPADRPAAGQFTRTAS